MDREAWWAAVRDAAQSWTRLSEQQQMILHCSKYQNKTCASQGSFLKLKKKKKAYCGFYFLCRWLWTEVFVSLELFSLEYTEEESQAWPDWPTQSLGWKCLMPVNEIQPAALKYLNTDLEVNPECVIYALYTQKNY